MKKELGKKYSVCDRAIELIRQLDGAFRTAEAIKAGVHPQTLYTLLHSGIIERLSRGVYKLADTEQVSQPDLVIVATRIPQAVICLISALAFHEMTSQIPHEVSFAIAKGAETPRIDFPPISVHRFSGEALTAGVQKHEIDGVTVRIFCPEKTIADCFKFRNKIGMDIALEALKLYKARKGFNSSELIKFARICRVEKVMLPYLEAMI
ncbi:MAG: transcriptional regulator [Candidatus Riflebacteria bacterium]|nr:transcriptional regulator [Candidatus Riflebacteria bacterium]